MIGIAVVSMVNRSRANGSMRICRYQVHNWFVALWRVNGKLNGKLQSNQFSLLQYHPRYTTLLRATTTALHHSVASNHHHTMSLFSTATSPPNTSSSELSHHDSSLMR